MNTYNFLNLLKKNINTLLIVSIILIAAFLRLYALGSVPVGPDWDEAALGYNAYSILKTGRDEYGTFLPLAFRSFDDYKPPLYVYLTVPSVAVFGLTIWAVRLPSAVMGVFAVIGTYFLVVELLYKEARNPKHEIRNKFQAPNFKSQTQTVSNFEHLNSDIVSNFEFRISSLQAIALLSALLLAISPWHIQFSRVAFEANIGVTFNIWAAILFLKGLRNAKNYYLSSLLFILGMYSYHTERIFVPLYVTLLSVVFMKHHQRRSKALVLSLCFAVILILPMVVMLVSNTALERFSGTSIFTKQTEYLAKSVAKYNWDRDRGLWLGQLLNDRRFEWMKVYASGYLAHFSPKWLFVAGDYPRHHAPDSGLMYLWTMPFLGVGLLVLLKWSKTLATFLIGWLLLAPVASAFTFEVPHAVRTLVFLPSFQIVTAVGIMVSTQFVYAYIHGANNKYRKILVTFWSICFIGFSLFEITRYLNLYFVHMNPEYSEFWQYGYKEAVDYTEKNKDKYEKVVVSTTLDQSYMFFLFYTKYDPVKYLTSGGTKSGSFEESNNRFDTYEFRKLDWSKEVRDETIMYVGAPGDMPHGNLANITFQNGKPAIEIADNRGGAP